MSQKVQKQEIKSLAIQLLECIATILFLCVGYSLAGLLTYNNKAILGMGDSIVYGGIMVAVAIISLELSGFFKLRPHSFSTLVKNVTIQIILLNFIFIALLYFSKKITLSPYFFIVEAAIQILLLVILKRMTDGIKTRTFNQSRILIVYADREGGLDLERQLRKKVAGSIALAQSEDAHIKAYVEAANAVYICGNLTKKHKDRILSHGVMNRKMVYLVPETYEIALHNATVTQLGDIPTFEIHPFSMSYGKRIIKRVTDIVISVIAIVLILPIMAFAAIAIKREDGGPVFYRQIREGRNRKEFSVIKFRSMLINAEKTSGAVFAAENDPRITKIGKLMRATRIDEIPQFFNVLAGSMSVVGPRPERPVFVKQFSEENPEYINRLLVKPGISGLAQVMGNYTTTAENKLKFDLMYIKDYSILLDFKILFKTVGVVLHRQQATGFATKVGGKSRGNRVDSWETMDLEAGKWMDSPVGKISCSGFELFTRFVKLAGITICCAVIVFGSIFLRYSKLMDSLIIAIEDGVGDEIVYAFEVDGHKGTGLDVIANVPVDGDGGASVTSQSGQAGGTSSTGQGKDSEKTEVINGGSVADGAEVTNGSNMQIINKTKRKQNSVDEENNNKVQASANIRPQSSSENNNPAANSGGASKTNSSAVLTDEQIRDSINKMSTTEMMAIFVRFIYKLSTEDLVRLEDMAIGGFTAEEKDEAKAMMELYFEGDDVRYIKEVYWKVVG